MNRLYFSGMLFLALAGCATTSRHSNTVISQNTDVMRIGDEPQGFPLSRVENFGGYCVEITDSWRKSKIEAEGQPIWLKQTTRVTVSCH